MKTNDDKLLRDLHSVVLAKLSESQDGRRLLGRLRKARLSVYLVVDDGQASEPEALPVLLSGREPAEERAAFRIDHEDLRILRDLGIDPTRKLRRRR